MRPVLCLLLLTGCIDVIDARWDLDLETVDRASLVMRIACAMSEEPSEAPRLLISDVILPHMSGPELRERLLTELHDLPCLFISGYTARFAAGDLGQGVEFLQKPFSPFELVRRARRILDGRGGRGEPPAAKE